MALELATEAEAPSALFAAMLSSSSAEQVALKVDEELVGIGNVAVFESLPRGDHASADLEPRCSLQTELVANLGGSPARRSSRAPKGACVVHGLSPRLLRQLPFEIESRNPVLAANAHRGDRLLDDELVRGSSGDG
jgi:hypothetical protein